MSISDFFRGDSTFVAVGNEKISFTDVQDIIETLYPDSHYAKSLLRNIEKQKRKAKQQMLQSLANDNQELQEKQGTSKPTKKVPKHTADINSVAEDTEISKQEPVDIDDTAKRRANATKPSKRAAADSPREDKENEAQHKPKGAFLFLDL